MGFVEIIRKNRLRLASPDGQYPFLSAALLLERDNLSGLLLRYASGLLLDIGAGVSPYQESLSSLVDHYFSLDISVRSAHLDCLGHIERLPFKDEIADTVLCTQVLEHVPHPQLALKELWRVMKKGGRLILTTPHLSRIHEAPHDYFRFTEYGLRLLCEESGFRILSLNPVGSLLSFLGHTFSTVFLSLFGMIPGIRRMVHFLNLVMSRGIVILDRRIDKGGIFALNYQLVAEKPKG
ncbi:MAG: class I SAM-dependent methyltransferase [Candidatus Binatia bacterium]